LNQSRVPPNGQGKRKGLMPEGDAGGGEGIHRGSGATGKRAMNSEKTLLTKRAKESHGRKNNTGEGRKEKKREEL